MITSKRTFLNLFTVAVFILSGGICQAAEKHAIVMSKHNSIYAAQNEFAQLPPQIKNQGKICPKGSEYYIVSESFDAKEEATSLQNSVYSDLYRDKEIIQINPSDCFQAPAYISQAEPPKKEKPTKKKPKSKTTKKPLVYDKTTRILPETTTKVFLSNRDINRIYCEGNRSIKDVIYSKEKGLIAKTEGSNTFIKFLVKQLPVSQEREYNESPTELYVICAPDTVYTLIAAPQNIPAQTILLSGPDSDIKTNLSLMSGLPYEKKITSLIKDAYVGKIPPSYTQKNIGKEFDLFQDLNVFLNRIVRIEGEGLQLKEYILSINENSSTEQIEVTEKSFILPELAVNPVGVSLESLIIEKDQPGRLFIVEQRIN